MEDRRERNFLLTTSSMLLLEASLKTTCARINKILLLLLPGGSLDLSVVPYTRKVAGLIPS